MSTRKLISTTCRFYRLRNLNFKTNNIPFLKLNQSGAIFPYLLSIMLLVSSYLVMTMEQDRYQLQQLKLLEEQQIVQNLIQITIHDFKSMKDQLEINTNEQTLNLTYETGYTIVHYRLLDENSIQLRINVYTDSTIEPFIHSTIIRV